MLSKIGFLTVRRHEEFGYFGGYLVVNQLARPLEFHCTLPVKPSRAQTVLYGPTLEDFVCGEQIGKALIGRAKITADLVVTDVRSILAISLVSEVAIVQLDTDRSRNSAGHLPSSHSRSWGKLSDSSILSTPQQSNIPVIPLSLEDHPFYIPECNKDQRNAITTKIHELGTSFDYCEPFERIVEALLEANPNTKAA